jgi:hypothetical protein
MDLAKKPHRGSDVTTTLNNSKRILMKMAKFLLLVCFAFSACDQPANFEGGAPKSEEASGLLDTWIKEKVQYAPLQQTTIPDRQVIKTGYLTVRIDDMEQTRKSVEKICKEHNAYISSEMQNNYDTRMQYEQVIRMPAISFDVMIQKLESLGVEVENKSVQTTDVTEEFIDKEARIKTKKELEIRYREILKQAKVVSDILSIESQLNQVRGDIESMEGRLKFLQNQVAFSTLNVTFYKTIGTNFGFGSKIVSAARNGWDMFLLFIIGLLNIWPFLLIGAALLYLGFRRMRNRRKISEAI